jgi:hypothetical protein
MLLSFSRCALEERFGVRVLMSGLARTLGNLSRLAPCLIDSYIGHVDVSPHDARRPDNGED